MKRLTAVACATSALLCLMASASFAGDIPEKATELLTKFQADEKVIMQEAEQAIALKWNALVGSLVALQSQYTKAGDLDNALLIRDTLKTLSIQRSLKGQPVLPDPGTLSKDVIDHSIGKSAYYRVTGRTSGSLWGTDIYTSDSTLGTAAVHAGVLKPGQEGVIKVTYVTGPSNHPSTTRNGVTSSGWGPWSSSFTVEALE